MCVNDLIVCGAKPLFFLDYYASSKLDVDEAALVIKSITNACIASGCALLGGETAEMPGHYIGNNFDLAGFSVGCVDEKKILNNENVKIGNVLLGIESSGPHSNGFSLIRKIINDSKAPKNEIKEMVNKALMPTILYPSLIMDLIKNFSINSISHITGGGLLENLPRSIPKNLSIEINTNSWKMPKIFRWLQDEGNVPQDEMYRIFNCGIGMVLIVDEKDSSEIRDKILEKNYKCFEIGKVCKNKSDNLIEFI
jgi:phosphoribosylformylglycinamidine cyclo-ligase